MTKQIFDYLPEKFRFTIKLGQIISHEIVKKSVRNHTPREPEEINQFDRFELAKDALSKMPKDYLVGNYEKKELIMDMAFYIDKRIPQAYAKWKTLDHSKGPTQMKINAADFGLRYQFKENEKKKKKAISQKVKSPIITPEKTKLVKAVDINESKEVKKGVDEQVRESNFVQLKKYLSDNGISIGIQEFRAILFTMNGMSLYFQTKSGAIKKASDQFNIPQKMIRNHIDEMGIVSERFSKNKKQFSNKIGRETAIGIKQLQQRLDRED